MRFKISSKRKRPPPPLKKYNFFHWRRPFSFDEHIAAGRLDELLRGEAELSDGARLDEGGVAEVVCHHDRGVQGREVQRGDRYIIVT